MATGAIDRANPLDQPVSRKALVSAEYQKQTVPGTTIAKAFYDGEDLSGLDPGESYAVHQGPYLTILDLITLDSDAGENPQVRDGSNIREPL